MHGLSYLPQIRIYYPSIINALDYGPSASLINTHENLIVFRCEYV